MARQLNVLLDKVAQQRDEISLSLEAEWKRRVDEATETATRHEAAERLLRSEVDDVLSFAMDHGRCEGQVSKGNVEIQGLSHEKALLEKRVEHLASSMTSSQICCSLTGISVSSLAELDKIQKLEFERQTAADDLESWKGKYNELKRSMDDSMGQCNVCLLSKRHTLKGGCCQGEIEYLKCQLAEGQQERQKTEMEVGRLEHEIASLRDEVDSERAIRAARVGQWQHQMTSLVDKHRKRLTEMDERVTRALESVQHRVAEALLIVEDKETLQHKRREEIVSIAHRLESIASQHKLETKQYKERVTHLASENGNLRSTVGSLEKATEKSKKAAKEAEKRLRSALHAKARLEQNVEDLYSEVRYVHEALEQSQQEIRRCDVAMKLLQRERDFYGRRYESLRRKAKRDKSSRGLDASSASEV